MNRSLLLTLGLLTSTFASACSFDLDLEDSFPCSTKSPTMDPVPSDAPLAVGSAIVVSTEMLDSDGVLLETLTVESSNPAILEVTVDDDETTVVFARSAGTAEIIVRRANGAEHGRQTFTVVAHDRVELASMTALLAGATETEAHVVVPKVLVDGSADFAVRFFAGATQLQSTGLVVSPDISTPGAITVAGDGMPPIRASLTPTASGIGDAPLVWVSGGFGGTRFDPQGEIRVPVEGVTAAAVASITAVVDETGLGEGWCATAVPVARDADGIRLDGMVFDFTARSSRDLDTSGEVLNYEHVANNPIVVTVEAGDLATTMTIHSNLERTAGGSAAGCSASGLTGATQALPILAALGALAARGRRRSARIAPKS